ncbi:unnamed protein product [Heterobilharzia americana]|nr:unnamed protein product [Heterobilharzia americana]
MDCRSKFILSTVKSYFHLHNENIDGLEKEAHVNSFLDSLNVFILACHLDKSGDLSFKNEVSYEENIKQMLVFIKLQPTHVDEKNWKSTVMVCSIPTSPVSSFYNSISKLFAPLLLKNDGKSMLQDPKLQTALADLAAGLSTIVSEGADPENSTSISNLMDEVNYWRNKSQSCSNNSPGEKKRCKFFASVMDGPAQECNRIESASQLVMSVKNYPSNKPTSQADDLQNQPSFGTGLIDLIDVLDSLLTDTLDDLWRCSDPRASQPYPEQRMRQLMKV